MKLLQIELSSIQVNQLSSQEIGRESYASQGHLNRTRNFPPSQLVFQASGPQKPRKSAPSMSSTKAQGEEALQSAVFPAG